MDIGLSWMKIRLDGCRVWMGMTLPWGTLLCHAKDQSHAMAHALLWDAVLLSALSEVQKEPAIHKIKM